MPGFVFRIWLCVQTLVPKRYLPWMDVYPPSQIVRWDQTNIKPISGIETYTLINVFMEKKTVIQCLSGKCREHLNPIFQTSCNRTCIDLKDLQNMS